MAKAYYSKNERTILPKQSEVRTVCNKSKKATMYRDCTFNLIDITDTKIGLLNKIFDLYEKQVAIYMKQIESGKIPSKCNTSFLLSKDYLQHSSWRIHASYEAQKRLKSPNLRPAEMTLPTSIVKIVPQLNAESNGYKYFIQITLPTGRTKKGNKRKSFKTIRIPTNTSMTKKDFYSQTHKECNIVRLAKTHKGFTATKVYTNECLVNRGTRKASLVLTKDFQLAVMTDSKSNLTDNDLTIIGGLSQIEIFKAKKAGRLPQFKQLNKTFLAKFKQQIAQWLSDNPDISELTVEDFSIYQNLLTYKRKLRRDLGSLSNSVYNRSFRANSYTIKDKLPARYEYVYRVLLTAVNIECRWRRITVKTVQTAYPEHLCPGCGLNHKKEAEKPFSYTLEDSLCRSCRQALGEIAPHVLKLLRLQKDDWCYLGQVSETSTNMALYATEQSSDEYFYDANAI